MGDFGNKGLIDSYVKSLIFHIFMALSGFK